MRKFVFIQNVLDILSGAKKGKRIEGVLYMDKNTGLLTFKPYFRKAPKYSKDKLIAKLPWGWVKESLERIKVYGSFPKDLGTAAVINLQDDHNRSVKNALIEREIVEFC